MHLLPPPPLPSTLYPLPSSVFARIPLSCYSDVVHHTQQCMVKLSMLLYHHRLPPAYTYCTSLPTSYRTNPVPTLYCASVLLAPPSQERRKGGGAVMIARCLFFPLLLNHVAWKNSSKSQIAKRGVSTHYATQGNRTACLY